MRVPRSTRQTGTLLLLCVVAFSSTSCVVVRKVREWQAQGAAEDGVRRFRLYLDHEIYHGIYADASEHLQHGTNEESYVKYLRTIHELMGNSSESRQLSEETATTAEGILVSLKYSTHFSQGIGVELFQWIVRDGRAQLYAYYFDSSRLRHP